MEGKCDEEEEETDGEEVAEGEVLESAVVEGEERKPCVGNHHNA